MGPWSAQGHETEELIREISEKQRGIETLTANFSQRRETSLLQESPLFAGVVKFKRPGRIYFVYSKPELIEISLDGKFLTTYDPGRSRAERYALSRSSLVGSYMESVTHIFQKTLDQLAADYSVHPLPPDRADCHRFRLHPRKEAMQEWVKEVELRIDKASGAILTFEMIEPNQDRLILEFRNLQINPPLTDQDLEIKIPPSADWKEKHWP